MPQTGGTCQRAMLVATLLATVATAAEAQLLRKLKKTAERALESEVLNKVDQSVRSAVRCAFDDAACIARAKKDGTAFVLVDDAGAPIVDARGAPVTDPKAAARQAAVRPGEGAWANYDFVPGDEVLFGDDFAQDRVGDFPRRLDLVEGNFEIVEWQGRRLLRATSNGAFAIPLPRTLPERFTVEFDARVQHGNSWVRLTSAPYYYGRRRGAFVGGAVNLQRADAGLFPVGDAGPKVKAPYDKARMDEALLPVRVMADGAYMKVYIGERRVVNAPNAVFPRSDTLYIAVGWALEDAPILLGPIRVAAGGRDLYDRLARDGRVATQGILFSTGSDRLRPESTPTLQEIATMLQDHDELRLRIEGHTDDVGDDASNQSLSERRAASVREWLIEDAGILPSRLEAQGYGESKPVAPNTTPEGRQQNRRVELVQLGGAEGDAASAASAGSDADATAPGRATVAVDTARARTLAGGTAALTLRQVMAAGYVSWDGDSPMAVRVKALRFADGELQSSVQSPPLTIAPGGDEHDLGELAYGPASGSSPRVVRVVEGTTMRSWTFFNGVPHLEAFDDLVGERPIDWSRERAVLLCVVAADDETPGLVACQPTLIVLATGAPR